MSDKPTKSAKKKIPLTERDKAFEGFLYEGGKADPRDTFSLMNPNNYLSPLFKGRFGR